jgi:hypothetical protein
LPLLATYFGFWQNAGDRRKKWALANDTKDFFLFGGKKRGTFSPNYEDFFS